MVDLTIIAAFIAGFLSFLSPCVLPLIPGFLGYLAGVSAQDKTSTARIKIVLNSLAFVLGFSLVFAILGVLLNSVLGSISYNVQTVLSRVAGVVIILFGLYLLGLIKIRFLEREHKLKVKKKFSVSYITSFVFGAAFAVGWTPCVGALLGTVLALATMEPAKSFTLLMAYSIGLGIPFILTGIFSARVIEFIRRSQRFMKYFNIAVGILLVALGVLVFTNNLNLIANLELVNWILLR